MTVVDLMHLVVCFVDVDSQTILVKHNYTNDLYLITIIDGGPQAHMGIMSDLLCRARLAWTDSGHFYVCSLSNFASRINTCMNVEHSRVASSH